MREGEDYNKTYAPVASRMSIRLLLTFVVAFGWETQQVDYVAAYTQAPIDCDMYMEFPRGFKVPGDVDRKDVVLKLHRNLYGQKQAGRVWYEYLCKRLVTKVVFRFCSLEIGTRKMLRLAIVILHDPDMDPSFYIMDVH